MTIAESKTVEAGDRVVLDDVGGTVLGTGKDNVLIEMDNRSILMLTHEEMIDCAFSERRIDSAEYILL